MGGYAIGAGSTLPEQLWNTAHARGDAVAIREKHLGIWQEVSWLEYLGHVRRCALGLVALGVKPGDRVAIQAENCQEWLYTDLGVQCAGAVVVTVYPTSSNEEIRHILETSGARVLVAGDQEHLDKALALRAEGVAIDRIVVFDPKGARELRRDGTVQSYKDIEVLGARLETDAPDRFAAMVKSVRADSLYDIMYTSGTSGLPKGARCVQQGPVEGTRAMLKTVRIDSSDSWLSYLPLSHAFERIMAISVHLATGCVVNFADSIDTVQADLAEIQPTIFGAVPRIMEKIKTGIEIRIGKASWLKRAAYQWALRVSTRRVARQRQGIDGFTPAGPLREMTYADYRGERVRWTLADRIRHFVCQQLVFRALRKRIGLVCVRTTLCGAAPMSNELFQYFIAIGVPITNAFGMTELHNIPSAADPEEYVPGTVGHVLPGWSVRTGTDGEIQFRGPIGFLGYQGQADGAGVLDADGWLHTGDLGEVYDNACIRIVGRKKDVLITSGGKNVSPEFMENKLKASAYVSEAILIGDGRKYLTALIELDAEAVGDHLQRRGIAFTTLRDMAENEEVLRLVQSEIDAVNETVSRVEAIKKFAIIPRDLSHDDGEMTPTRKVKRLEMSRKFGHLIERMYADDDPATASAASARRAQVH